MKPKPTKSKRRKPKFNADVWESDWTGKWSPVAKRRKLAEAIADKLFLHGGTEMASRLQIKLGTPIAKERDGGGWCYLAVFDVVAKLLKEHGI